jgi:hypothetical protein
VASTSLGRDRIGGPAVRSISVQVTEVFTDTLGVLLAQIAEARRLDSAAELLDRTIPLQRRSTG